MPPQGNLPEPGTESSSLMSSALVGGFFTTSATWEACLFYLFYLLFYFLTLQYCIGFSIYQHESTTDIHVFPILNPPPSPYHPSESSQCTSPKHPVSFIEPGLATHFIYDIIHVSVFFGRNDAKAETPVLWPPHAKS